MQPWNDGDQVALMGDASHAIVPFYGQGMNSGMEGTVLDGLIDAHENWDDILSEYTRLRKPAGDGIMKLALQNYIEMRDLTGDPFCSRNSKQDFKRRTPTRGCPCIPWSPSATPRTTKPCNVDASSNRPRRSWMHLRRGGILRTTVGWSPS